MTNHAASFFCISYRQYIYLISKAFLYQTMDLEK